MRIAFQQHFTTISSGSNFRDCTARNRQAEWSKNIAEWAAFVANFLMAIYVWKTSLLSDILLWLYYINKNWTIIAELRSVRSRLEEEQRARQRIENELDQHNEKVTNIPGKGITVTTLMCDYEKGLIELYGLPVVTQSTANRLHLHMWFHRLFIGIPFQKKNWGLLYLAAKINFKNSIPGILNHLDFLLELLF